MISSGSRLVASSIGPRRTLATPYRTLVRARLGSEWPGRRKGVHNGYLGSGYGLGPITQGDLVCWPVRRPVDGRAPAILLVPAGDQVAVPAWRHGRVWSLPAGKKGYARPACREERTHAGSYYAALATWRRAGWRKNGQQWARPGSAGPPRVARDGIGGHASRGPEHDSGCDMKASRGRIFPCVRRVMVSRVRCGSPAPA
jgi:hypothetical protein